MKVRSSWKYFHETHKHCLSVCLSDCLSARTTSGWRVCCLWLRLWKSTQLWTTSTSGETSWRSQCVRSHTHTQTCVHFIWSPCWMVTLHTVHLIFMWTTLSHLCSPSGLQRADRQRPPASRSDRCERVRGGRSGVSRWGLPQFEETPWRDWHLHYRHVLHLQRHHRPVCHLSATLSVRQLVRLQPWQASINILTSSCIPTDGDLNTDLQKDFHQ